MSRRTSDATSTRRPSLPDLMRRHSSLLASLTGDAAREGIGGERRQSTSDLEREFPNLRSTPRPSTCHSIMEEEMQALSKDELEQLLENCTKLTRNNQLTEGRLWGLALPQRMPELAKQDVEDVAFNFQKVSSGLDAAVQIYSKRVDSMHNAALDTRSRLTHRQKEQETASVNDDVQVTVRKRVRRHTDFGGDSTLATNLDTITIKDNTDDVVPLDPLFHKTSALFDGGGGFKGLPTLNLGIKRGGRYRLDMNETWDQPLQRIYDLPPGHKLNLDAFGIQLEQVNERKQISHSSKKIYSLLGRPDHNHSVQELVRRGMNSVALPPQTRYEQENGGGEDPQRASEMMNIGDAMEADLPHEDDAEDDGLRSDDDQLDIPSPVVEPAQMLEPPLSLNGDGAEMNVGDYHPTDVENEAYLVMSPRLDNEGVGDECFAADVTAGVEVSDTAVDMFDEDTISWLLDPTHDKTMNRSRAWTGASHWKYPAIASGECRSEKETDAQQRKRVPPKAVEDYTCLPQTDLSKFKKADKDSSISSQMKEDATHLLPSDYKIKASDILRLPLAPSVKPRAWISRLQSNERNAGATEDAGYADDAINNFPEECLDVWDDGFDTGNEDFDFGLIQAPPQIREDTVRVDATPTRANMGQVKAKIWSKIEELSQRGERTDNIPFQSIIGHVVQTPDVSVAICFACLLQLAAEHQFDIVNTSVGEATIMMSGRSS